MKEFSPAPETASIVSVADRVRKVALVAPAGAVHFLGGVAVFVSTEETIQFVAGDGSADVTPVGVHGGGILCSAANGARLVTGGDDGALVGVNAKGEIETLARDAKHRWIDDVTLHADGTLGWSAGKTAFARSPKGEEKTLDVASTVGGLGFAPKGVRLAIAHYNGVTLWFPNMAAKPEFLEWKGSHLGVTFSPDNKFVVSSMHEAALHGWRLADGRHMRMSGYPSRVHSMSWSAGGKQLATSGSDSVILWPFATKDGPMGKEPAMLAPLQAKVTMVACHPRQDIFAAGYSDGTVLLVRINDGAEILVHRNHGGQVAALAWNAEGSVLAFATEEGEAGLLTL